MEHLQLDVNPDTKRVTTRGQDVGPLFLSGLTDTDLYVHVHEHTVRTGHGRTVHVNPYTLVFHVKQRDGWTFTVDVHATGTD